MERMQEKIWIDISGGGDTGSAVAVGGGGARLLVQKRKHAAHDAAGQLTHAWKKDMEESQQLNSMEKKNWIDFCGDVLFALLLVLKQKKT